MTIIANFTMAKANLVIHFDYSLSLAKQSNILTKRRLITCTLLCPSPMEGEDDQFST